jgi:hypothetical protein
MVLTLFFNTPVKVSARLMGERSVIFMESSAASLSSLHFSFQTKKRSADHKPRHTKLICVRELTTLRRGLVGADPCLAASGLFTAICGDTRKISDYKAALPALLTSAAPKHTKNWNTKGFEHFSTLMIGITSSRSHALADDASLEAFES